MSECSCIDGCEFCYGIVSGKSQAPSWCPSCKQLRTELEQAKYFQKTHVCTVPNSATVYWKERAEKAELALKTCRLDTFLEAAKILEKLEVGQFGERTVYGKLLAIDALSKRAEQAIKVDV